MWSCPTRKAPSMLSCSSTTASQRARHGEYANRFGRSDAGRPRVQEISRSIRRQSQPGAFLLGCAGPGSHSLFRQARTRASCSTTLCGIRSPPMPRCSNFRRRRMKLQRTWATGTAYHSSATTPQFQKVLGEKLERGGYLAAQQCIACGPFGFRPELLEEARLTGDQQRDRHTITVEHAIAG